MRKIFVAACVAVMAVAAVNAQQPVPALEELIPGSAKYKTAAHIGGLKWWGDVCVRAGADSLFAVDLKTGRQTFLLDRETVNEALKRAQQGRTDRPDLLRRMSDLRLPWPGKKEALIMTAGRYSIYNMEEKTIDHTITIPPQRENDDYCAESNHVAYTIHNNLYIDGKAVTDEPEGVVCGQSVHRNEFGIHKGTFWGPKGNLLAFYRMDERMVAEYPLVDVSEGIAELKNTRYPMAGMESHRVNVGIYDLSSGITVYLNTGDPADRYFTNISWSPDGKSLYLIELNRDQNHAKLCRYNAATGEPEAVLLEEKHPKYVEPQQPIVFLPWDDGKFIYQSQRDGFNHLYLHDTTGKQLKQLTSGDWLVQDILGFCEKSREVIIASTECSPLQTNIFRVNAATGKRTPAGTTEGVHSGQLSHSGQYFIDYHSSPDVARSIDILDIRKGTSCNLLTAEDPFEGYKMPVIETGTIKAADGQTDLYYRLTRPADLDDNKKYPAIIYVYGGPHAQMVNNGWRYSARGWDIYMATQGYVMLTVDNRGSSNRGLEFENCTFRKMGIEEGKDQMEGVSFLGTLPYVDMNRIGVHGWSFGGHLTIALMLRHPDVFKVGVAGGPVTDWKYYEVMYGERYMDTPELNREGYDETNLNYRAQNLEGRLMLVHGDMDGTCLPIHTLSFMKACVDFGTYPDLLIYPGHEHNVRGRDRVHLYEKITKYFQEHL